MQRRNFSPKVRQEYLRDAITDKAIKCTHCHYRNAVEIHHNTPVCEGGTDDPANLLMLCKKCHTAHHSAAGDFKVWGGKGGSKTAASMKSFKNLLQFRGIEGEKQFEIFCAKKFGIQVGITA